MAERSATNKANSLISLYVSLYKEKYKKPPVINRYREKWGFIDMLDDLGEPGSREVIEFYFRTGKPGHPVSYLLYNYDSLRELQKEYEEDAIKREQLRKETKKRVEETYGESGT